jgi:O-antigen biosynthesis protein
VASKRPNKLPISSAAYRELDAIGWAGLRPRKHGTKEAVMVIIPVYGALQETLQCIHSVLSARCSTEIRLVVVDDCSPDPAVFQQLSVLGNELGLFELWQNDVNRGFVYSVNRGLFAACGHIILLNSDTIVADYWVDRLVAIADSDETIASVSPMTNNATILSYPHTNRENELVDGLSVAEMDRFFSESAHLAEPIQVPVNVGFCMLLAHNALQATGGFDEALFGTGYGEECDWCMRATYNGYKHVAAVNTFVYHKGSVSFSGKAARRQALAGEALSLRYPEYWTSISRFCNQDPLLKIRRNIDVRRLERHLSAYKGIVLHVLHSLGGGTELYARRLAGILSNEGIGSFFIRPDNVGRIMIGSESIETPNLLFDCVRDVEIMHNILEFARPLRVHIHSTIGFSPEAIRLLEVITIPKTITIHDYVAICPQLTLLNQSQKYCGVQRGVICNICVKDKPPPIPCASISIWREDAHKALSAASQIIAPSQCAKQAIAEVFPDIPISVVPHLERHEHACFRRAVSNEDTREIALAGSFTVHKGRDIIKACVLDAHVRQLPLKFVVFGSIDLGEMAFPDNLRLMGPYAQEDLGTMLLQTNCRIGFLPSIWPETYSYVLSEFVEFGLYPVVFDLGAQAERVREAGIGSVLETGLSPVSINNALLSISISQPFRTKVGCSDEEWRQSGRLYLSRIYGMPF